MQKTNENRYVIRQQNYGNLLHGRRFLQVFQRDGKKAHPSGERREAPPQQAQPHVGCRGDDHPHSLPHGRAPLPEALLPWVCVQALGPPLPQDRVVQQVRGTGAGSGPASAGLRQAGAAGQVHGHQLRRLHADARLPQPAHPLPQGVQGHRHEGQVLHGMVLRLQDASHHQREGRSAEFHDHPGGCRRQGAAEGKGLREGNPRKTGRRQGLHIQGTLP